MNRYAIGDIHGCLKTFQTLLEQINYSTADELILLGDYVDRGPDSKGVFDHIFHLREKGHNVVCLRGNHEQMLLDVKKDDKGRKSWLNHGGVQTLMSFDAETVHDIPNQYIDFMIDLPSFYITEDFIFVHGGLNFKRKDPFQDEYAMLWERAWYNEVNYKWLDKKIIVHGHTPSTKEDIEDMGKYIKLNQYINLDCGCFVSQRRADMGFLTALNLDTHELYFQKCIDDVIF
jgi:serine/threonine protein phosphatase 1